MKNKKKTNQILNLDNKTTKIVLGKIRATNKTRAFDGNQENVHSRFDFDFKSQNVLHSK